MSGDDQGRSVPAVPKVLVVDDDDDIRDLTRMCLELTAGWTVLTAEDGFRALEVCRADPPDVVLLDVMMPGMDGPEVVEHLQEDDATARIPVILFTAKGRPRDASGTGRPEPRSIAKPFDPMTLADEIVRLLGWPPRS